MRHVKLFEEYTSESEVWSGEIETKFTPKPGIFTEAPEKLAKYLKNTAKDLRQAMARLNFYINRGGKNIEPKDKARLEKTKEVLRDLYTNK